MSASSAVSFVTSVVLWAAEPPNRVEPRLRRGASRRHRLRAVGGLREGVVQAADENLDIGLEHQALVVTRNDLDVESTGRERSPSQVVADPGQARVLFLRAPQRDQTLVRLGPIALVRGEERIVECEFAQVVG